MKVQHLFSQEKKKKKIIKNSMYMYSYFSLIVKSVVKSCFQFHQDPVADDYSKRDPSRTKSFSNLQIELNFDSCFREIQCQMTTVKEILNIK